MVAAPSARRRSRIPRTTTILAYVLLVAMGLVFVYPLIIMLFAGFKTTPEIFQNPFGLPPEPTLNAFSEVWRRANFPLFLRNSIIVCAGAALLLLACAAPAAYALARYRFWLSSLIFLFFLAGIMIPIRLGILPLFLLMRDLQLLDTPFSLIPTYAASGMPMSVFLLSIFFRALPSELEDAARVDGCSEYQIFYRVMLPLVRPGLATVTIVNVVPWWNDFFFPLLFIQSDRWKTIPLGMQVFFGQHMTDWGLVFAGMLLASLPLLALYIVMSRQFIAGLTAGAVKG